MVATNTIDVDGLLSLLTLYITLIKNTDILLPYIWWTSQQWALKLQMKIALDGPQEMHLGFSHLSNSAVGMFT
jgi:hypothetical protein